MQFTKAESYGIFGVIFLAEQQPGKITPLSEISEAQNVPEKFLAKIFQSLSKSGIIRSHRGVKGGFSIGKQAGEITVKEIIESVHGPYYLAKCLNNIESCNREHCPLKVLLQKAQYALSDVFTQHTIADLMKWQRELGDAAANQNI